jgi:hypothetical protein
MFIPKGSYWVDYDALKRVVMAQPEHEDKGTQRTFEPVSRLTINV